MEEELESTAPNLTATVTLADESSRTGGTDRREKSIAWQGMAIGRYTTLSQLGAGAMGVVLAAYDPQLDRRVALKLLAPRSNDPAAARARLQREAQALAKLDNPNVVGVHDVGLHGDQLFVAMDFVAGKTLGAWMAEVERPRPYKEVLAVFAGAGRGLAAAHRAGLIHRDFKPDNVMLGDDGRVRVMDFGLARVELELDEHGGESREPPQLTHLTRAGMIMGTPAYMPLEQFEARETDARSDQFSFCVSLYQALYGERPFAGRTFAELQEAVEQEKLSPPRRDVNVPAWLRKVVVRGLAKDPARRWPSMPALLDALADDPAQRRRKWVAAAGLAALLGGSAWALVAAQEQEVLLCRTAALKLDGTWEATRRAALQQAILNTHLSYAPETWARVERHLDDYANAWISARTEVCEATHAGEQSSELMDLRMACLDDRLLSLSKTIDELARADETAVKNAVTAVLALPSLDRCSDIDALQAEVPLPDDPEVAARVQQLDERLLEARAKADAGRYADALALTDEIVAEAGELAYEPLRARAWLRQAKLRKGVGELALAETSLKQAFAAAVAQRMPTEAMNASVGLVILLGMDLSRTEGGRQWAEFAEPLSRAVGTEVARAEYLAALGDLSTAEGKFDDARASYEAALAIRESASPQDPSALAAVLRGLGIVSAQQGEVERAREYFQRALATLEDMLGPQHPAVAAALGNVASIETMRGDLEAGRELNERSLAITEQALGPEHPDVAVTLHNLGNIASWSRKPEEARDYYKRALTIEEKHFGAGHPKLALTLLELGNVATEMKAYDEAQVWFDRAMAAYEAGEPGSPQVAKVHIALGYLAQAQHDFVRARNSHQRALEINERAFGPDDFEVAYDLAALGDVAYEEAKYEEARGYQDRALAIFERVVGPSNPEVAGVLCHRARTLVAVGESSQAVVDAERALGMGIDDRLLLLATCRFVLASALWEAPDGQGRDRARAREFALLARDFANESGDPRVENWLRNHGGLPN